MEAWQIFHKKHPDATLLVAGNVPYKNEFDVDVYNNLNVNFVLTYLSDSDYINFIATSKCVVLPYTRGTNSGVVYTVISMSVNIITSDIPMFQSNYFLNSGMMFKNGDVDSLVLVMDAVYKSKKSPKYNIESYRDNFRGVIVKLYHDLLK
ncbi:hypothetical protein AGMMS49928_28520 [Spirochaetia bacterium]|nr:hypothetical protein AGMMS49928_28520 [Spirochaetia bacterium]